MSAVDISGFVVGTFVFLLLAIKSVGPWRIKNEADRSGWVVGFMVFGISGLVASIYSLARLLGGTA